MCGIVGAISKRAITPLLIEGLKRLEYRGYDSAGLCIVDQDNELKRLRVKGKVNELDQSVSDDFTGCIGIAHTRWATHGEPSPANAHPHFSKNRIALVHNGIIENHENIRHRLIELGYEFTSETDSEVVAHLVDYHLYRADEPLKALVNAAAELKGAFALGLIIKAPTPRLLAIKHGSPLVIGLGFDENFFASDTLALQPVTQRFLNIKDGELAELTADSVKIYSSRLEIVQREEFSEIHTKDQTERGNYRHFMLKEIFEQPSAVRETLQLRADSQTLSNILGEDVASVLESTRAVQIVACGTSYHAAMVARYWIESLAGIPCAVEIASEYRYQVPVVMPGTLFIGISQSGETADTLAAMRHAKQLNYLAMACVCNIEQSAMVRESDIVMLTRAGREIGVASTKCFTTQLSTLLVLSMALARNQSTSPEYTSVIEELIHLPSKIEAVLELDEAINQLAERFAEKQHALFLGRGIHYPIALEGALKLKEISYIHAEAYPAGELKHGPLALIDKNMPVIANIPNNTLLDKVKSNLQEVKARGGELIVFADDACSLDVSLFDAVIRLPVTASYTSPILHTIPLQLLAYHVAVLKGTDVDQPRNLAKSVTVE